MEISAEQWEEARRLFEEKLPENLGMPLDKRDTILQMLDVWHDLSAKERRMMSGGNHIYWNAKYMVVGNPATEEAMLCFKEFGETDATEVKQVCAREELWSSIMKVHTASTPAACAPSQPCPSLGCCSAFSPVHVRDACGCLGSSLTPSLPTPSQKTTPRTTPSTRRASSRTAPPSLELRPICS
jgi:hypothetical protein